MALSQSQKQKHIRFFIALIILAALHLAVASLGYIFYKDTNDYSLEIYVQTGVFWVVGGAVTLIISMAFLLDLQMNKLSAKIRLILTTLMLLIEFALGVTLAIFASDWSIGYAYFGASTDTLENSFYYSCMADTIITFTFNLVCIGIIYLDTLQDLIQSAASKDLLANTVSYDKGPILT